MQELGPYAEKKLNIIPTTLKHTILEIPQGVY